MNRPPVVVGNQSVPVMQYATYKTNLQLTSDYCILISIGKQQNQTNKHNTTYTTLNTRATSHRLSLNHLFGCLHGSPNRPRGGNIAHLLDAQAEILADFLKPFTARGFRVRRMDGGGLNHHEKRDGQGEEGEEVHFE